MIKTYQIEIKGLVQGVGFRPFIYRIAKEAELKGWVLNSNEGVTISLKIDELEINDFIEQIRLESPPASRIESMKYVLIDDEEFSDFHIIKSSNRSEEITEISPDIAVCDECLADMKSQKNRINYPFINCTNCGPRFSIVNDLPYDREMTTMKRFAMCEACRKEYTDVADRRFHAQPVACKNCGPEYMLVHGKKLVNDFERILESISNLLHAGKILAFKGIGGFHLACDARNNDTVKKLRELKNRDAKPFAVMFRDMEALKEYAELNSVEEQLLCSWRRPIVLLKQKKILSESINSGLDTIGSMLPYMPFHHLLFERTDIPAIVLTSGNISDEPIITDNKIAIAKLADIADAVLVYNRDISNRTDDSVAMVTNNKPQLLRRSRGYAPSPVNLKLNVDGIMATGAELKNCFCIGKGNMAIMSQHIGDIKNLETLEFYTETIKKFKKLFRVDPELIVCDMHLDYLSTKYAKEQSEFINRTSDIGLLTSILHVQHHYAHIASVMAEHDIDEKIIGISFDGTGLGDDNNIWGSEFFVCDLNDYIRYSHFEYVPMPGGDKASEEPWRMGLAYLYKAFGKEIFKLDIPFINHIIDEKKTMIIDAIDKKINCPLSCGAGRLFDAVAAIMNICTVNAFEAEAPIKLESIIETCCRESYNYKTSETVSFNEMIKQIVHDISSGISNAIISAKFHNTIINVMFDVVKNMQKDYGITKVALSGGSFQNRYILSNIENLLIQNKFQVYRNEQVPSNDGGLALGQLAIGAKWRENKTN